MIASGVRWFRPLCLLLLLLISPVAVISAPEIREPLLHCEEVRALTRERAATGLPVRLRGVVTFAFLESDGAFVLNDESAGVYVARAQDGGLPAPQKDIAVSLKPGMLLEVIGVSGRGAYAPQVYPQSIRVLGDAPLPPGSPTELTDLLGGHLDCQRARIRGVVQRVERRQRAPNVRLELGTRGGHLAVFLMDPAGIDLDHIVNTEVEVTGVVFSFFNERGELIGANVQIRGKEDLIVIAPAPVETATEVATAIDQLKAFSPSSPSRHRSRIVGTVTVHQPGSLLYVQDGRRGIRVNTRSEERFLPGDRVEVLGFPEVRGCYAEMCEASVKKIGVAPLGEVREVTRAEVLTRRKGGEPTPLPDLDGSRIALRASIKKVESSDQNGWRIYLDCDGHTILANLLNNEPSDAFAKLEAGSEVRVTGVCVVQLNTSWPASDWTFPQDFKLMVHSPADFAILRAPSWWTMPRILVALGVAGGSAVLALIWVAALRRRVATQTAVIREQAVRQTLIEDRSRMARELHDTLEQELMGLSLQLDAVSDSLPGAPEDVRQALESAQSLLKYTRTEARRSIWDLRALALEENDLAAALRWSAACMSPPNGAKIQVETLGNPRRLPARVEAALLRVGNEALTNALKHARAQSIVIQIVFGDPVELRVTDDGIGFSQDASQFRAAGSFGIIGMRERVRRIGGVFQIQGAHTRGTELFVSIPLETLEEAITAQ